MLREVGDRKAKRTPQRHEGKCGDSKGFTHIIGGRHLGPHFSLTETLRDEEGRHRGPSVESAKHEDAERSDWMALCDLVIPPHSHRALLPSASDLKAWGPLFARVPSE